jgi:AraC-like DNA-binding protein
MVPSGRQYMLFILSGSVKFETGFGQHKGEKGVSLQTIHDFCYSAEFEKDSLVLAAALRPNALHKLYRKRFDRKGFFVAGSATFPGSEELQELYLRVKTIPKMEGKIAALEQYFESKTGDFSERDIVDDFLDFMGDFRESVSTREIARRLHTNQRSLEVKFSAITGITPGRYIRLMRFIHLYRDFAGGNCSIRELILKYDYIDYSHLCRDFRKYTGISLKESHLPPESLYYAYLAALDISLTEGI